MLLSIQIYPVINNNIPKIKKERIGIVGTFNESEIPLFIKNQISTGLTRLSSDGQASPGAAINWDLDATKMVYTFHLNKNLIWHDGKPLRAQDINYQFQGTTVTPIDDLNLKVTLKQPYSPLPVALSQPLFKTGLIGLGMYKTVKIIQNEGFIKELDLVSLENGFPEIIYKFYPSLDDAIFAFKLGEIDSLKNVTQLKDLAKWKNVKITESNMYDRIVLILLNLKNPDFKDKELRQAFNYAIPNIPGTEKALSPISPLSWAYSNKIRLYNYDPTLAEKLFSKTPFSSPSSELVLNTYSSLLSTAQTILDSLAKVGVNLKIKVGSDVPDNFDMFLTVLPIPADPDQYLYWQSLQQGTNISNYNNPKIDKLLEDGRKTFDLNERRKIYADFQRYIVDDSPAIFLYYPKVYSIEKN